MSGKILFVDDDPNLLAACERNFRRHFPVDTADGGEAGLAKIAERGPYAVVVSDRQMPRMDGIQFLSQVRQTAPDTVRILLTGNVDLEAAVRVVNEGNIFRFLIKPCPQEILLKAIEDGRAQHRLITAEKELLNQTLSGSIRLLTEILATVETRPLGQIDKLRGPIAEVVQKLAIENGWEIHLATMLAPIGYVTLPPEIVVKSREGRPLSRVEEQLMAGVPETAARLLANIPRLEGVARIVRFQNKHFDGTGMPAEATKGEAIPLGSRLLKIFSDLAHLQSEGMPVLKALDEMQRRKGWYDPKLLAMVLASCGGKPIQPETARPMISVTVKDLAVDMLLCSDVLTRRGTLVLSSGHHLNQASLEKIQNFDQMSGIQEPIFVEIAH
jgi:response regulator RpfG family c-di-GMP phosphodiesterase